MPSLDAFRHIADFAHAMNPAADVMLLHVGETLPIFDGLLPHIELRQGPVIETILAYAGEIGADLIAMPTQGRRGLLDALRGLGVGFGSAENRHRVGDDDLLVLPDDHPHVRSHGDAEQHANSDGGILGIDRVVTRMIEEVLHVVGQHTGDEVEGGGLTRPIGPQEAKKLALFNLKAHAIERRKGALGRGVGLGDGLNGDGGHEGVRTSVVSGCYAAPVLDPAEHVFDLVALAVCLAIPGVVRAQEVMTVGRLHYDGVGIRVRTDNAHLVARQRRDRQRGHPIPERFV